MKLRYAKAWKFWTADESCAVMGNGELVRGQLKIPGWTMFRRLSWLKQRCIVSFRFISARLSQWATPISQLESKCMSFFSNLYCCHFLSFFSVKQSRWNPWSVWGFVLWRRQCSTGQETEIDEIDWCDESGYNYNSDFKFCCHKFFAFNDMQHHIDDGLRKHSHWRSFPMTS